jgi:hypothetical protein
MKKDLNEKGHLVRTIIVKHRATKVPLPLFFVDLDPRNNNREIYQLQFLQHCKIRVEPPRHRRVIAQCARCQTYGHTEEWLYNIRGAKARATQKSDCTIYTVPKLGPHKRVIVQYTRCQSYGHTRVIVQYTRCQSYGHTKEWLYNIHGAKARPTQKIVQYTRCQS